MQIILGLMRFIVLTNCTPPVEVEIRNVDEISSFNFVQVELLIGRRAHVR